MTLLAPTLGELAQLGAVDVELYNRTFFPKTFRQASPPFAKKMNDIMEAEDAEFVNLQLFRGSSKTTRSRAYMSRRVAYGTSRVMLCICSSAAKAEMSVKWVKKQVEYNRTWADTFGLEKGDTWRDWMIEIRHTVLNQSIWMLAFGLEGSHRGINIEDWRPDYIDVDDIIDEENSASIEQRHKAEDLVLGSLMQSLAPRTENPQAKMVVKQTPFHKDDFTMKALRDPSFISLSQGCWTEETKNLPIELQQSVWPERFPSEKLRAQKVSFIARNKASLFAREMECRLVTPETSDFKPGWLKRYSPNIITSEWKKDLHVLIAVDPVPPPTDLAVEKDLHKKDFECLMALGYKNLDYYVLEYVINRGHDPQWTIGELFRLIYAWNPRKLAIESIAYQATLQWLVSKAMTHHRRWVPIHPYRDRRKKSFRINDAIAGPASHGHLYVQDSMSDLITQFEDYPKVSNDDILDTLAIGIDSFAIQELADEDPGWGTSQDDDFARLSYRRGSP